MSDVTVELDDEAIAELVRDPAGPVVALVEELSLQGALIATAVVHVRPGTPASARTGPRSTASPPGYTKANIRPHLAYGPQSGIVYGGVNAPYEPTTWLETPADQIARKGHRFPFLTTALDTLEV